MSKVKDVIEKGQPIPADVIGVTDCDGDELVLNTIGHWHSPGFTDPATCIKPLSCGVDVTEHAPLTVTAVREPEPDAEQCWYTGAHVAHRWNDDTEPRYCMGREPESTAVREPKPERTLIGPPHAHLDAPCTDKCYETASAEPEPSAADVSPLLDLVRQYGDDRAEAARRVAIGGLALDVLSRAETLLDRIAALVPQQPDPSVLSLPQVPEGAVALVGAESGKRWVPIGGSGRWQVEGTTESLPIYMVIGREGSVTVVMREPRTWPRLDGAPVDVKAFHGDSGRLYTRSTIGGEANVRPLYYPAVAQFEQHKAAAARPMSHWREVDGPLTEVLVDEPGGEPR